MMTDEQETENPDDRSGDDKKEKDTDAGSKPAAPDKAPAAKGKGKSKSDPGADAPQKTDPDPNSDVGPTQVWHSGDWKSEPAKKSPYNGLEITGIPTFDKTGKFVSAKITFNDYTNSPKGVSSVLPELEISHNFVDVPQPRSKKTGKAGSEKQEPGGDVPTNQFSVAGQVRLESYTSGLYLRVHLSYGPEKSKREELGNVFQLQPPSPGLKARTE